MDFLPAERCQHLVHHAAAHVEQREHDEGDDDHGKKARQNHNGVVHLHADIALETVEHQRQTDGQRVIQRQKNKRVGDGVADNAPRILRFEEELEIFQADELAAEKAFGRRKILKRNHHAEHRQVMEQKQQHQRGQHHQHKLKIVLRLIAARFFALRMRK